MSDKIFACVPKMSLSGMIQELYIYIYIKGSFKALSSVFFVKQPTKTWIYFHGNLNGIFSVIVLNTLLAIFNGSKPFIEIHMNETFLLTQLVEKFNYILSSSSGKGIGPFLSAVKRPSHDGMALTIGSSFFLILY